MFGLPGGNGTRCAGGSGTAIRTPRPGPAARARFRPARASASRSPRRASPTRSPPRPRPPGRARAPKRSRCAHATPRPPGGPGCAKRAGPGSAAPTARRRRDDAFREETGRCAAIHDAAAIPAPTSPPCASVSLVISAKYRSESVSPSTRSAYGPSSASSRASEPKPPLWAMTRPFIPNGWVLRTVRPPAVAHRTWATNADDSACRAARRKSRSRKAGSGCLSSTIPPSGPK